MMCSSFDLNPPNISSFKIKFIGLDGLIDVLV